MKKYLDKAASIFVVGVVIAAMIFGVDLIASYANSMVGALLVIAGAIAACLVFFGWATFRDNEGME